MAGAASARRGQPIAALTAIILGWVIARAVVWTPIVATADAGVIRGYVRSSVPHAKALVQSVASGPAVAVRPAGSSFVVLQRMAGAPPDRGLIGVPRPVALADGGATFVRTAWQTSLIDLNPAIAPPRRAPPRDDSGKPPQQMPAEATGPTKDDPRWSSDRWLLMRRGSGAAAQAPGAASYGASQAGAVVRYRFGKGDQNAAYGYLRTSLAINAPGKDKEIALGLGGRPVAKLPLRVLAEARLYDSSNSPMRVRPVATVVTEIPWQRLPMGFRAEAYGQAGYAGGRDSTAFFDVQGLVDHPLKNLLPVGKDLRIGAGVWAGGQKGAVRLDLGPRVSFAVDLGEEVPSRIALDWRFRVAGNARPGSGPAITVASSF